MLVELDKEKWAEFVNAGPARAADNQRKQELSKHMEEAEQLIQLGWSTNGPWPGIVTRGSTTAQISVETWVFMNTIFYVTGLVIESVKYHR